MTFISDRSCVVLLLLMGGCGTAKRVPAGRFERGSPEGEAGRDAVHRRPPKAMRRRTHE
ncbi:hypothetical protein HV824_23580 [Myxococcus sp. AM009]|uniref:hypothetical protein n=1 Tax=Myxococcus sp. AM009 TaxID=2745137 RepID=UPI0015956FDB|nr:hypothetical protein [Myxococcus sp. AM009]NVJ01077.1 hypothetical protein [Myxococcus sp. AM009]